LKINHTSYLRSHVKCIYSTIEIIEQKSYKIQLKQLKSVVSGKNL